MILKITPNINEEQFIRLKIDQQVTKISGTQTSTPTTLKRTAKTTVVVKDKETVVIGGMIDDSTNVSNYQVPCLGDIPLSGVAVQDEGEGAGTRPTCSFSSPPTLFGTRMRPRRSTRRSWTMSAASRRGSSR